MLVAGVTRLRATTLFLSTDPMMTTIRCTGTEATRMVTIKTTTGTGITGVENTARSTETRITETGSIGTGTETGTTETPNTGTEISEPGITETDTIEIETTIKGMIGDPRTAHEDRNPQCTGRAVVTRLRAGMRSNLHSESISKMVGSALTISSSLSDDRQSNSGRQHEMSPPSDVHHVEEIGDRLQSLQM